ncbi:MAG: N-acetylmuramoyl-L-alanine amidase [Firmicutes bacterium]|nr:N-acetylmuramoyl-L-alanine amidase [Bacillota bacterium]
MVVLFFLKRKIFRFLTVLGILFCLVGPLFLLFQVRKTQGVLGKLTVVIDPGHGGVDGGTADRQGNLEKAINLKIAQKVGKQLRQTGLKVVLTRNRDTDLAPFLAGRKGRHRRDLMGRINKALRTRCAFLISIHCDYSMDPRKQGAVVFYNYLSESSKEIAGLIQEELNIVQERPGKIAPGKYLIIRQKELTGVLVEVGFLSSQVDAEKLQTDQYREQIAGAISKGILRHCRKSLDVSE